jgi:ferrous-iron efflux pump FieF
MQPPDREHRFGHGKAEPLAALAQAAFIIGSSALLSLEALGHILDPKPLNNSFVGYTVMLFAIFMTLCLLALQNYTVRKTNSLAIKADRLHYAGDALINLAVIVALAGHEFLKLPWLDPFFALLIAGSMIWGAVRIGKHSMDVLMDSELPEEDRRKIFSLALSVAGVKGAHDLRTRSDGVRPVIEMHVEMPPSIRLREAHEICENIERKLHKTYPEASILLHQDPVGVREERLDEQIEKEPSSST